MSSPVQDAWYAVQFDQLDILKTLVPSSVSPNACTVNPNLPGQTLLQCAAAHGAIDCATYLIQNGADVHGKNFLGFTPLHWSAWSGRYETVDLLLENGADIEARACDGTTPLHVAAERGHLPYIREFLKSDPDIAAISSRGWTALHFAVVANQRKTAKKLVELGLKEDGPDAQGKTLADIAAEYQRSWFGELAGDE
jgi:ankyrin repeat protein